MDVKIFESGKKKCADLKISGYVWTGPELVNKELLVLLA